MYSGNYWANIHLLNKNVDLSCYNIYFTIESSVNEKTKDFGADYNGFDVAYDDIPFVMLV